MNVLKKERKGNGAILVICLFTLTLMNFMGFTEISNTILCATLLPFFLLESYKQIKFKKILIVVIAGIFLSMISCLVFREQTFYKSLNASSSLFLILFYFFLTNRNYSLETVEKSVLILGLFVTVLYLLQFFLLKMGIVIIPSAKSALYASSIEGQRFRIIGSGFIPLILFLSLNKIFEKKGDLISYLCTFLCFMAIIFMGFRTMLAAAVIFSFVLSYKVLGIKKVWKFIVVFLLLIFVMNSIPAINDMFTYMVEKQQEGEDTFANEDYVRWLTFDYFMNNHFNDPLEMVLGSGLPGTSKYGRYMYRLNDQGIFPDDWGMLGLSWMVGIIPVFFMLCYSVVAFILKIGQQYKYIGIWFIYLLAISITTSEFYRDGNFVAQALALYMVAKANHKYQVYKLEKS